MTPVEFQRRIDEIRATYPNRLFSDNRYLRRNATIDLIRGLTDEEALAVKAYRPEGMDKPPVAWEDRTILDTGFRGLACPFCGSDRHGPRACPSWCPTESFYPAPLPDMSRAIRHGSSALILLPDQGVSDWSTDLKSADPSRMLRCRRGAVLEVLHVLPSPRVGRPEGLVVQCPEHPGDLFLFKWMDTALSGDWSWRVLYDRGRIVSARRIARAYRLGLIPPPEPFDPDEPPDEDP